METRQKEVFHLQTIAFADIIIIVAERGVHSLKLIACCSCLLDLAVSTTW
jgi:hypothetical protein